MMSETLLLNSSELGATASDWLALLKPRVMTLVVYSGAVGLVVAPVHMNPILALTAILCIAVGAGAAGAINMWYDRDIDAVMRRTASRPVAAGRIEPASALGFGVVLAVGSVLLMAVVANLVAAGILLLSIAFYVFIYTMWLKRLTPQNIVIGGAAGAFPPLLGWAAATGSISVLPVLMFAIIFFWTPPHFWALSLYASEDYKRAGVPMLPGGEGGPAYPGCGVCLYADFAAGVLGAVLAGAGGADLWGVGVGAGGRVCLLRLGGFAGSAGSAGGQPERRRAGQESV